MSSWRRAGGGLAVPWQEDGVVQEVLKEIMEESVVVHLNFLLLRLGALATRAFLRARQVRLGVLLWVQEPVGWKADRGLDLCLVTKAGKVFSKRFYELTIKDDATLW